MIDRSIQGRAEGGRRPVGLERMLRIHFLQQWYALSDPAVEDALYDSGRCGGSRALIWDASRHPTRRRCASSAICWKSMAWPRSCSKR